jgi:hypothetical protein
MVQGYEKAGINYLINNIGIEEDDLRVGPDEVPFIEYQFNNKNRFYFPDIYVKSKNLIVEVKSTYTFQTEGKKNNAKMKAAFNAGYDLCVLVFKQPPKSPVMVIERKH